MVLQSKLFCCSVYSLRLTVGNHGRVSYYLVAKAIARKKCLGGGGGGGLANCVCVHYHFPRSALLRHRLTEGGLEPGSLLQLFMADALP